jgi:hypothetical protein
MEPGAALLSPGTTRAIHDALIDAERAEFEQRFAQEMAEAARTLDLTGVLTVLEVFRKVAEVTQREGAAAHRRTLEQVARLQRGEMVPDAGEQAGGLPGEALPFYAELIAFLELTPWAEQPRRVNIVRRNRAVSAPFRLTIIAQPATLIPCA